MPNATFASVAEDAPALLWRGDAEGRCVYLNKAQREFWGVPDDGVETFTWGSTLLPEDADKVYGPFGEGMANRTAFRCEGRYRRADGAIRILETIAQPRFEDGVFVGMITKVAFAQNEVGAVGAGEPAGGAPHDHHDRGKIACEGKFLNYRHQAF